MVKQQKVPDGAVGIPVSGRSRKCRRRKRLTRAQALRMLSQNQSEAEPGSEASGCKVGGGDGAVAGSSSSGGGGGSGAVTPGGFINGEGSQEFLSTGRTGRRNAMPDILGEHADTGTADLPERLEALTTDPAGPSGGSSGGGGGGGGVRNQAEPGPSQQQLAG